MARLRARRWPRAMRNWALSSALTTQTDRHTHTCDATHKPPHPDWSDGPHRDLYCADVKPALRPTCLFYWHPALKEIIHIRLLVCPCCVEVNYQTSATRVREVASSYDRKFQTREVSVNA